jgi:putative transposase
MSSSPLSVSLSTLNRKVAPTGLGEGVQRRARPRQPQVAVPRQTEFVMCDETIKGRKRHLLVDTLGLPISIYVTPADVHDTVGARKLLGGLAYFVPGLKKSWADAAYQSKELADWRQQQGAGWDLEVVERTPGVRGFSVQPRRWVVERGFAWLSRNRRLAKDYERKVQTSETLIQPAAIRLLLRRQARPA